MNRETLYSALNIVASLYGKGYSKPQILKLRTKIVRAYQHSKQFETVKIGDKVFPILYAQKVKDKKCWKTLPCFFCGEEHIHGAEAGHRVAHCTELFFDEISNDENSFKKSDGYVLELLKI